MLHDGQLAGRSSGISRRNIRSDKISWISGLERSCEAIHFLLTLIDKLISLCIGRLGKSIIRERSKVRWNQNFQFTVQFLRQGSAQNVSVACVVWDVFFKLSLHAGHFIGYWFTRTNVFIQGANMFVFGPYPAGSGLCRFSQPVRPATLHGQYFACIKQIRLRLQLKGNSHPKHSRSHWTYFVYVYIYD